MSKRQRSSVAKTITGENTSLDESLGLLRFSEPQCDCTVFNLSSEVMCVLLTSDDQTILAGKMDGTITVISLSENSEESLQGHTAEVKCLAVTSKNNLLISGSYDATLIVWNLQSLEQVSRLSGHTSHVFSVVIGSDDKYALSSSNDRSVIIWSLTEMQLETRVEGLSVVGYSLGLSSDDNLLAIGGNDSVIHIWNLKENREEVKMVGHDQPIYSLAISNDCKHVISASIDKTIRKWNMKTGKQEMIIGECNESIRSVCITSDDKYIVYGRHDGRITVACISALFEEINITAHSGSVNTVYVSRSSSYIVSGSNDCTMRLYKLSEYPIETVMEGHKRDINSIDISPDGTLLITASHDTSLLVWNFVDNIPVASLDGHIAEVYCVAITQDNRCVTGGADEVLKVWDLTSFSEIETLRGHDESIRSVVVTSDDKKAVSGSMDHTVRVWSLQTYEELFVLRGHNSMVNCLAIRNKKCAVSGSNDETIRVWDIYNGTIKCIFTDHKTEISCMAVSGNRRKLLCGGRDGRISIWNLKHKHLEGFMASGKANINKLSLSRDSQFIFTQHENKLIMIWSFPDKQILGEICRKNKIFSLAVSKNNEWIAISSQNKLVILKSPLSEFLDYTVVPYKYSFLFKSQVYRLLNGNYGSIIHDCLDGVILPWNINLMHIISHMNYPKLLKVAISKGTKFLGSYQGETPLTVSLHRRSKLCAEILIKRIPKELLKINSGIFEYLGEILSELNKSSLRSLPFLYDEAFPIVTNQALPKFGRFISRPPIIKLSNSPIIDSTLFLKGESSEELVEVEIEFRQSMLKLNLSKGSIDSIRFIKSLKQCQNADVFCSELVKVILMYKWRQILPYLMVLTSVYILLIIALIIHTLIKDSIGMLVVILVLNTIFFLYELAQMRTRMRSYFHSIWNLFDLIRIAVLYAYPVIVFTETQTSQGTLLAIANALSWIRLIGFIRIFDKMRYLIRMCSEIVKSMGPFMLVYITAIAAFCLCYYSDSKSTYSFGEIIVNLYSLSYGQFNNNDDTGLQTFVLVVATLILTLMMLNLIIALMGDVFQKVKGAIEVAEKKEMASIILEIDSIMWLKIRRRKSTRKYIQQCSLAEHKHNKNDAQRETEEIMHVLGSIGQKYKVSEKRLEEVLSAVDRVANPEKNSSNDKILELLMEIKSDIKETKKEIRIEMMKTKLDIAEIRRDAIKLKPK